MRLARYMLVDLRDGFREIAGWLAASLAALVAIACALCLAASAWGFDVSRISFGGYLVAFVAGIDPFEPSGDGTFPFPIAWTLFMLLPAYMVLWYPYRDLMGVGARLMVSGGSRRTWWASKCLWTVLVVLSYCTLAVLVALAFAAATGASIDLSVSEAVPVALQVHVSGQGASPGDVAAFLACVPLCLCALCLVQLLASLVAGPIAGFAVSVSTLFLSAFLDSPFLVGSYCMAARSAVFSRGGMDVASGALLALALAVFVVVVGACVCSRMDILSKERFS